MFTKIAGMSFAALTLIVSGSVAAQDATQNAAPLAKPSVDGGVVVARKAGSVGAAGAVVARGTITNVNPATREFTIKRPNGEEVVVLASDVVKNFDQIKTGDQVVYRQAEAVVLNLKKIAGHNGIRERTESDATHVAQPGDKPGIVATHETRIIANVTAVNHKTGTVTLRGVNGSRTLQVHDLSLLTHVNKGDQVEVVVTEGEALSVETAKLQ
ncbi:hypothetical protein [Glaciimonas soli]|uniref:DUF5666 domain-containing protein n=1 Tax=Glaciimonas soli TaxID=2590999 RepID=A0A843YM80_9BURK|nr:hypothetical protein [Glaciimonas soli]MQR00999.1 hypothetical protein [Glaciimonas soli]